MFRPKVLSQALNRFKPLQTYGALGLSPCWGAARNVILKRGNAAQRLCAELQGGTGGEGREGE